MCVSAFAVLNPVNFTRLFGPIDPARYDLCRGLSLSGIADENAHGPESHSNKDRY
jgi:hypothetical protein